MVRAASPRLSFKQLRTNVLADVKDIQDQDVIVFHEIEDVVRLKSKSTQTGHQFIRGATDPWKLGDEVEGLPEPCMIGIGLVSTEPRVREHIDIEKVRRARSDSRNSAIAPGISPCAR